MAAIDDLRNLITRVGTGLQMKPGIARSLTSGSVDAQIARLNANASSGEKDRVKLLEAESELLRKNNVLHRSNAIFRGYDVMRRFPNRFSSATQAGAWEQEMNRIANPNRSRLASLQEQFGTYGGSRIFRESTFNRYYKDLTRIGKSKWDLRREELFEQYGGTEDPNAASRAESVVSKERSEEAKSLRRSRRLKSLGAERAYKFDLMDEYDQEISTLTEKFGGGTTGRKRAEEVWQKNVFKEFRWLKPIAKNIPAIGKHLPAVAKTLQSASKTPIIGKMLRHPGMAAIGAATAGMRLIGSITESTDKGNAYVVSAQNAMNLYGKPSKEFENAAYLAGYKDPAQIAKLYGQLTMQFGSAEAALPMLGKALAKAPPMARMAVAQQFGLDANSMALIDILSGSGRINAGGEVRQTNALKNIASANILMGLSSESGVQTRAQIANFAQTLGFNPAGMDARNFREANLELYDRLTKQMIDNGMGANQAALSAADYISNGGSSATQSVRGGDTFILNGDVTLPNATDAEGFTEGIKDKAQNSVPSRKAVATAFDTTVR